MFHEEQIVSVGIWSWITRRKKINGAIMQSNSLQSFGKKKIETDMHSISFASRVNGGLTSERTDRRTDQEMRE